MKSKKIFTAIGGIDERFIDEDANGITHVSKVKTVHTKRYTPWVKWAMPVAACLVIAVGVMVHQFGLPPSTGNGGIISESNGQPNEENTMNNASNPPQEQTNPPQEVAMSIFINQVSHQLNGVTNEIALMTDDCVKMTADELNDYYGISVFPAYLPTSVGDKYYGEFGVYDNTMREINRGVYYDQNSMLYISDTGYSQYKQTGEMTSPRIAVTVSKIRQIHFDMPVRENLQYSDIDGNQVLFAAYEESIGTHFYAEFAKDDVNFQIESDRITQDEFVATIASYFAK
jgi:hypothetical protein